MQIINTDVLIIGGGPSGSSTGLCLLKYDKNISVTIVDQSDFNQIRVGEHVASSLYDFLQYLELKVTDFEVECFVNNYGMTSYWGSDLPMTRNTIFSTEKPSFQIDRSTFDITLLREFSNRGGMVLPRTKCIYFKQIDDESWQVKLQHIEKGSLTVNAKFLIDATGRKSSCSRALKIKSKNYDNLIAVGAFLKIHGRTIPKDQIMESKELGWLYTSTLNNNYSVATFFTDADIVSKYNLNNTAKWNELLQESNFIKNRTKGFNINEMNLWIRSAHTHILDLSNTKKFLAVGDAMASYDPISSMGIGFAFSSACTVAAITVLELCDHDQQRISVYQNDVNLIFENYRVEHKKIYQQEKRWQNSEFWSRRN